MEIINEKPISINKIKTYISSIKKREKELNFRAKKIEEYLKSIVKLKEVSKFKKDLKNLEINRLREKSIIHILNICPNDKDSLKAVLSSENVTLKEEDLNTILAVVNKYA